jgi:hypothetical protein
VSNLCATVLPELALKAAEASADLVAGAVDDVSGTQAT